MHVISVSFPRAKLDGHPIPGTGATRPGGFDVAASGEHRRLRDYKRPASDYDTKEGQANVLVQCQLASNERNTLGYDAPFSIPRLIALAQLHPSRELFAFDNLDS